MPRSLPAGRLGAVLVPLAVVLSGCASTPAAAPETAEPKPIYTNASCTRPPIAQGGGQALILKASPVSTTIRLYVDDPTSCGADYPLTPTDAAELIRDINAAPAWNSGTAICPSIRGAMYRLSFAYGGGGVEQRVDVDEGGCGTIATHDAGPRRLTPAVSADLAGYGTCHPMRSRWQGESHNRFTVPAGALSATLTWYPALSGKWACTRPSALDTHAAQHLANDINNSRSVSIGAVYHCPLDDGTSVLVTFTYRDRVDQVLIGLSGCGFMQADNRLARFEDPAVMGDLQPYAPHPWDTYVRADRQAR